MAKVLYTAEANVTGARANGHGVSSDGALEVELRLQGADAATLSGLDQFGRRIEADGERVRLELADEERLPEIAAYLVERGVRLYGMHAARPSLERVFLEVMGEEGRPG